MSWRGGWQGADAEANEPGLSGCVAAVERRHRVVGRGQSGREPGLMPEDAGGSAGCLEMPCRTGER